MFFWPWKRNYPFTSTGTIVPPIWRSGRSVRKFSQCHLNSLTLLHFPMAQCKHPPCQLSTKVSFCYTEEKEVHNLQESRALHQWTPQRCTFRQGARLGEEHLEGIINVFAIRSEITGQTSTETFGLHRWDFSEHHCKLLVPAWMYTFHIMPIFHTLHKNRERSYTSPPVLLVYVPSEALICNTSRREQRSYQSAV